MRIAIVSTATDPTTGARLMEQTARKAGHEVRVSLFDSPEERSWLVSSDVCIIRVGRPTYRRVIAAAKCYEQHNPTGILTASAWGVEHSFDKYLSYEALTSQAIATPQTYRITALSDADRQVSAKKLPLILKPLNHNGGKGITVARTQQELNDQVAYLLEHFQEGVAQHFYAEVKGKDIRAFVVGDEVIASMERTAPEGSDIANLTQGGKAVAITLDAGTQQLAIRAAHAFGALYAGVDLLLTDDGATVLEVNISPGFALADIAKVDLSAQVIDYLTKKRETHD